LGLVRVPSVDLAPQVDVALQVVAQLRVRYPRLDRAGLQELLRYHLPVRQWCHPPVPSSAKDQQGVIT
jgi:hypothetical protein